MMRASFYGQYKSALITLLLFLLLSAAAVHAQTTSFTYQGRLTDSNNPANGNYDLQFALFDNSSGGTQVGAIQIISTVSVNGGVFSVQLDFGANAFPGALRFLEIGARLSGAASFTTLSPRQQITSTPYAIRSLSAAAADTVTVAGVPGGSGNYVQNTTSQQAGNFNLSGNGTVAGTVTGNIVSATTQYNIAGGRILSAPPAQFSLFAGANAGQANTGFRNTFVGFDAGTLNTTGSGNSFLGQQAGHDNKAGNNNAYFGQAAGFFTTGSDNSFFGTNAGDQTRAGSGNAFFGSLTGGLNVTGNNNTLVGSNAYIGLNNLTNATAIGANAQVDQNNSLVLGSIAGLNRATNSVNVGIGTTTPQATLDVKGDTLVETSGTGGNIQLGTPNGETGMTIIKGTTSRFDMRFDGSTLKLVANEGNPVGIPPPTNGVAITTAGNVGIGTISPAHRLGVIGGPAWTSSFWNGSMEFGNVSAIGWQANTAGWHFGIGQTNGGLYFFQSSSALGSTLSPATYDMVLTDGGNVGIGTISPDQKLSVNGGASKPGGGSWDVFSDERLKTIKGRFTPGLKAVLQLQPLRYEYRQDNALGIDSPGEHIGFGAQAVQKIIPEAVSKTDKGYLKINNDPIIWTMLNAIKEQQGQIETLRSQNAALNARLRGVEKSMRKRVGSAKRRRS